MTTSYYRRTVEQLEQVASKFWPKELSQQESEQSVIPRLIQTQDIFTSILSVAVPDIEEMFQVIDAAALPANLFLKHLVVLADFGGESFKRITSNSDTIFPDNSLVYFWRVGADIEDRVYRFKVFPTRGFSNSSLKIDAMNLLQENQLTDLQKDAIAILLFGAASTSETTADVLVKCEISDYLGQPDQLERYIRQRYIWVSRITGGSQSNTLGQLAQQFVRSYLENNLGIYNVKYKSNGHIPEIRHVGVGDKRLTTFDLVVELNGRFVAIEISFQVTTNSVIERKSGQAQARYEQIHKSNYRIAYVLDGAGNFDRKSALRTLCEYSDCTVALSHSELEILCEFIREYFRGTDP